MIEREGFAEYAFETTLHNAQQKKTPTLKNQTLAEMHRNNRYNNLDHADDIHIFDMHNNSKMLPKSHSKEELIKRNGAVVRKQEFDIPHLTDGSATDELARSGNIDQLMRSIENLPQGSLNSDTDENPYEATSGEDHLTLPL